MSTVQYLHVPIGELRPNPFNPNRVSAENERKIRTSIERNGLFRPIIVREVAGQAGYEILGGQHRWEQARELGHVDVAVANLGPIDDARAKEICLIDNARYGSEDTLMLGDILKDLGDVEEIQSYLPYGDTDLASIFAASNINLDSLALPETDDLSMGDEPEPDMPAKPVKTHTVMRFKIANADAERLTALIAKTQKAQDFRHEDALTNAGDALIHLIAPLFGAGQAPAQPEDWDDMLSDIEKAQQETEE